MLVNQQWKYKNKDEFNKNIKIRLGDLCIEQKFKVGQLIKTLEQKKQQIQTLTQELQQQRNNINKLRSQILQNNSHISILQSKIQQLQQLILQFNHNSNKSNINKHQRNVQTTNQSINTQYNFISKGIQTRQSKKPKILVYDVSVQTYPEKRISPLYPYSKLSKSFEKIMGKTPENTNKNSFKVSIHWKNQNQPNEKRKENKLQEQSDQQFKKIASKWFEVRSPSLINNTKKSIKNSFQSNSFKKKSSRQSYEVQERVRGTNSNQLDQQDIKKILNPQHFNASKFSDEPFSNNHSNKSKYNSSDQNLQYSLSKSRPRQMYETHLLELVHEEKLNDADSYN